LDCIVEPHFIQVQIFATSLNILLGDGSHGSTHRYAQCIQITCFIVNAFFSLFLCFEVHSQDNISNDSPNEGFEIHLNEINVSAQMKEFFLSK